MGLHEPLDDWAVDRGGVCANCAVSLFYAKKGIPEPKPDSETPTKEIKDPEWK
jgi:hypothetical protein